MNMLKKILIALAILVVLVLAGYLFLSKKPVNKNSGPVTDAPIEPGTVYSKDVGGIVSSGVEKTNPFGAKINPLTGYKNPFSK